MIDNKKKFVPDSAYVQKARKLTHFTITSIGGTKELEQWKLERASIEDKWQKDQIEFRAKRRAKAIGIVSGDLTAPELTSIEKAEITYRRNRIKKFQKENVYNPETNWYEPIQKTTLLTKIKETCSKWLKNLWNNAFDPQDR